VGGTHHLRYSSPAIAGSGLGLDSQDAVQERRRAKAIKVCMSCLVVVVRCITIEIIVVFVVFYSLLFIPSFFYQYMVHGYMNCSYWMQKWQN